MDWIEKAERQIEAAYESGSLTEKEYHAEMRDLQQEIRGCAEDAAQEAYDGVISGGW